ncbi:Nn.00g089020.m01.CDS01 [Neocucurbitaria sp. VM-36]
MSQFPSKHASSVEQSPRPSNTLIAAGATDLCTTETVLPPTAKRERPSPIATDEDTPHTAKRHLKTFNDSSDSTSAELSSISKRRPLSSTNFRSINVLNKDHERTLPTPPISPPEPVFRTTRLTVQIPQRELTQEDQRTLKIRRAAAERWQDKLQRPFPARKEITQAYNLKLLRHYPNPLAPAAPNFVKPHIDKSPRVDRLRNQFPLLSTLATASAKSSTTTLQASPIHSTPANIEESEKHKTLLKANKIITRSEYAQRLAWRSFSSREEDRIDRGREAMMESGLWEDDLGKESQGQRNQLPEWKKPNTGRFAEEQRRADTS